MKIKEYFEYLKLKSFTNKVIKYFKGHPREILSDRVKRTLKAVGETKDIRLKIFKMQMPFAVIYECLSKYSLSSAFEKLNMKDENFPTIIELQNAIDCYKTGLNNFITAFDPNILVDMPMPSLPIMATGRDKWITNIKLCLENKDETEFINVVINFVTEINKYIEYIHNINQKNNAVKIPTITLQEIGINVL